MSSTARGRKAATVGIKMRPGNERIRQHRDVCTGLAATVKNTHPQNIGVGHVMVHIGIIRRTSHGRAGR